MMLVSSQQMEIMQNWTHVNKCIQQTHLLESLMI